MDITTLRIAATLACFALFIGIAAWTYARRNLPEFSQAAQIPFNDEDAQP